MRVALRHRYLTLIILIATVGLNFWLYVQLPFGFFPQQDTGRLQGFLQGDPYTSFQLMSEKLKQMMKIAQEDPDVDQVSRATESDDSVER